MSKKAAVLLAFFLLSMPALALAVDYFDCTSLAKTNYREFSSSLPPECNGLSDVCECWSDGSQEQCESHCGWDATAGAYRQCIYSSSGSPPTNGWGGLSGCVPGPTPGTECSPCSCFQDGRHATPKFLKDPYCNPGTKSGYTPGESKCKVNACSGDTALLPPVPAGAGVSRSPCAAFRTGLCAECYQDYDNGGFPTIWPTNVLTNPPNEYKEFQCNGGVANYLNKFDEDLWKDVETRSLSDLGGTCCGLPVCYNPANAVVKDKAGNAVRIMAGAVYDTAYQCRSSCDSGWRPVQYSDERCENMGLAGICCTKQSRKGCGNGTLEDGEQCERGVACANPLFPNCGADCICRSAGGIGGGGGGGAAWFVGACVSTSCVLMDFAALPVGFTPCATDADCSGTPPTTTPSPGPSPLPDVGACNASDECELVDATTLVPGSYTACETDAQCIAEKHKACVAVDDCELVDGPGADLCQIGIPDCSAPVPDIPPNTTVPVADATVGDSPVGQNQGCASGYYPSAAAVEAGTAVTLRSDRDSADRDCMPSYDFTDCPSGENSACPDRGSFDYGTMQKNPECCLQYNWECVSDYCPSNLSNPDPASQRVSHDKNPSFAVSRGDSGKEFEFQLVVTTGEEGVFSNASNVVVNVASWQRGFLIVYFLAVPPVLNPGQNFDSITVDVKNSGGAAFSPSGASGSVLLQGAEKAKVRLLVADPVTGLPKGIEAVSTESAVAPGERKSFSSVNPADFPDFSFDVSSLPPGAYKLVAEVYRAGSSIPDDSRSLYFSVGRGTTSVPESGFLVLPLLLAIVLLVLWREKRE